MVGMRVGDLALVDAFFEPQLLQDSVASGEAEACGLLLPGFGEVMFVRGMAKELRSSAATRFRELGWRLYEAIALELAANLRAAARVYRQCGARSDVARLAAGETRKLKYAPFGARLSPRELEVAHLVAAKRSNRDIALAFDISIRTVDHHIEAAFSKLGIRNRWQLGASMLEAH